MKNQIYNYIPYGRQNITDDDIKAVIKVLKEPMITQGQRVPDFENSVAELVGAKHAIAMNSATSALHIACKAIGLTKGNYLWTTPNSFVASANCGLYCGAKVDFVDISFKTGLICIDKLKIKLEKADKEGKLPKVLVPVHFSGSSCDMEAIYDLSNHYKFNVIEDASHAIGGEYKNQPVGNCRYSKIVVFSFHPVKIITTAEGGMATTNDPSLAQKMSDLRSHGITKDPDRFENPESYPWSYEQQDLGFNYRMNDIQAGLGLSQLKRIKQIVCERNSLLNNYRNLLGTLPVDLLDVPIDVLSSVHLAVIRLRSTSPNFYKSIFQGLRNAQIGVQLHYVPIHLHPYFQRLGFKKGDFPNSERHAMTSISIPLYPGLKENQQEYVCDKLDNLLMTSINNN